MKKNYTSPELEIISFSVESVLAASGDPVIQPEGNGTEIGGPIEIF